MDEIDPPPGARQRRPHARRPRRPSRSWPVSRRACAQARCESSSRRSSAASAEV